MATFKIEIDRRHQNKDGTYNLNVRVTHKNEVLYCKIAALTENQYNVVFVKNSTDQECINFRKKCNKFKSRCEEIYDEVRPFNKKLFRQKLKAKDKISDDHSLVLRDLFTEYVNNKNDIKIKTKEHYNTTINVLERFKPDLSVLDITPSFLKSFEKANLKADNSLATVNSYLRHLRSIINYFRKEKEIIPSSYVYPFGKPGYVISSYHPSKSVLSKEEIQKVMNFKNFDNSNQKYALNIWKMLYWMNGCNFIDLLKLKWKSVDKARITFIRTKTENTRKNNIQPVIVPLIGDLPYLIEEVADKDSNYVLGKINDAYTDGKLANKSRKMRKQINKQLSILSKKLGLSMDLKLQTARDCYATSLMRKNVSTSLIGKMLNHSNVIVTEHYLSGLNPDELVEINSKLVTCSKS